MTVVKPRGSFSDYLDALGARESSNNYQAVNQFNFLGRYQLGEAALQDIGFVNPDGRAFDNKYSGGFTAASGVADVSGFLNSPEAQDRAAQLYNDFIWSVLRNLDVEFYDGQVINGVELSVTGMLGGSWLVGFGALRDFIRSGGTDVGEDRNGTQITEYIELFANYDGSAYVTNLDKGNIISGGDGVDVLKGRGGNDTLDGGDGQDTAVFCFSCAEYIIKDLGNGSISVQNFSGNRSEGTDTVLNIENLQFTDTTLAVADIEFDENGQFVCAPSKDAAILIDVSGSMGDDIARVKANAARFIDSLFADEADARVKIITYNDSGQFRSVLSFTSDPSAALAALNGVNVIGGGAEPIYGAMLGAMGKMGGVFRLGTEVFRQIINFTDEPPADQNLRDQVISRAQDVGVSVPAAASFAASNSVASQATNTSVAPVIISTVLMSGGNDPSTVSEYQALADGTGGHLVSLENDEDAVDALIQIISSQIAFTGTDGDDEISGNNNGNHIDALGGDDLVRSFAGADYVILGEGADILQGSLDDLDRDVIEDFGLEDRIIIEGLELTRNAFDITVGSAVISVDENDDSVADGSFTLAGNFTIGDFMALAEAGSTVVTFEEFLPVLQEGQALDPSLVNGIINQNFLKGDGSSDFQVTLRDMGFAGYNNVVGVYEIDASGNIVDTRILFENANADKSAVAGITDVEVGNRLGFFIVQDAADWAATLADSDTLSFVNSSGAAANISDGSGISIAVNGTAVDEMVFHSFSEGLNSDGVQHALSGVDVGGEAITVGFEDLTGGGDRDYEDVVFRVEAVDDFMFA